MHTYHEHRCQMADGIHIYFREYGNNLAGTPIVCLHGLSRNCRDFHELALHLGRHHRVLVPDMRGRGDSDWDPNYQNYNNVQLAHDVLSLLDHTGDKNVVSVGTSMGGIITMYLSVLRPGLLKGAVLNDVGTKLDPKGLTRIANSTGTQRVVKTWDDAVANFKAASGVAYPTYTNEDCLNYVKRQYQEDANGVPVLLYDRNIGEAMRNPPKGTPQISLNDGFAGLKDVPTLLIRGAISDLLSRDNVAEMKKMKPDLQVLEVPDFGHAPNLYREPSLSAIDNFVSSLNI